MARRREDGFTLIELLVVMIIISILAAIAIPVFLQVPGKGYDAGVKSDLHALSLELESYYSAQLSYPPVSSIVQGSGTVTVAGSAVRTSPGDTFTIVYDTSAEAYCITGHNPKATQDWVYVSSEGGQQPATTLSCPSAGAF